MVVKLSRWAIFVVIISLLPIIWSYINLMMKAKPATVAGVIANGELLILIAAMCAGAIGELIGSSNKLKIPKIISSGITVVFLIISILEFSSIAEANSIKTPLDQAFVESTSLWLFLFSLISCGCCIALSET